MPIIIFTGGGTTGHVTKNLIVMEALRKALPDAEFHYIGSASGREAELVDRATAHFHPIPCGKLRRYFSLQTIPDFFRFIAGIWKSYCTLGKIVTNQEASKNTFSRGTGDPSRGNLGTDAARPSLRQAQGGPAQRVAKSSRKYIFRRFLHMLIFSSGGYVALPACIAAWLRGIPIITHETDSVPGLSNRIIGKLAKKVLLGFAAAAPYFNQKKVVVTGNPVSPTLFTGSREGALQKLGFSSNKPVVLVMGGSQGAKEINELVWQILPELVKDWQVIHLVGKGKRKGFLGSSARGGLARNDKISYRDFDYVTSDYPDFLAAADLVISRAGGNALAEIAALQKPAIIIPLMSSSADHQRKGAQEMARREPAWTVLEKPSAEELLEAIQRKGIPPLVAKGDLVGMTQMSLRDDREAVVMAKTATQKILEILLAVI